MKICIRMNITVVESGVWQSSHKTGWYPSSSTVTPHCSFQGCNMRANPRAEKQEQQNMRWGVMCVRKFNVCARSAGGKEAVTAKEMSDIKEKLGTLHWNKEKVVPRERSYSSKALSCRNEN